MTNNPRTRATCPQMRVAQHWSCFSNYPLFWMPQLIRACTLTHILRTIFSQTFSLLFSQNPMALQGHAPPSPSIPVPRPPKAPWPPGSPLLCEGHCLKTGCTYFCVAWNTPPTRLGISKSHPSLRPSTRGSTMTASQGLVLPEFI